LVGCQSEKLVDEGGSQQGGQMITLTVTKSSGSRTELGGTDGKQTVWSEGDQIFVSSYDGTVYGHLDIKSGVGETTGEFSGFIYNGSKNSLEYSVYPYNSNYEINWNEPKGDGTFDIPMIGALNEAKTSVQFYHTSGVACLKLGVVPENEDVEFTLSIENNGTPLQIGGVANMRQVNRPNTPGNIPSFKRIDNPQKQITVKATATEIYVPYFITEEQGSGRNATSLTGVTFKVNGKELNSEAIDLSEKYMGIIVKDKLNTIVYNEDDEEMNVAAPIETEVKTEGGVTTAVVSTEQLSGENKEIVAIPENKELTEKAGKGEEVAMKVNLAKAETVNETSVVTFEKIPENVTVTIEKEEVATKEDATTIALPSGNIGTTNSNAEGEVKDAVVLEMPSTSVTLKSTDGNPLNITKLRATTAENTLIINESVTIDELIVVKGNVEVHGKVKKVKRDKSNPNKPIIVVREGGEVPEPGTNGDFIVVRNQVVFKNLSLANALVEILGDNKVFFSDERDYAYMDKHHVENVNSLNFSGTTIESLAGIEEFKNLETLSAEGVGLKDINISKNKRLKYLNISDNPNISSLDVTKNKELEILHVRGSQISSIDLSKNTQLIELTLAQMVSLTQLDISNNTNLISLDCHGCNISNLDIMHLDYLTELHCGNQQNEIAVLMNDDQKNEWGANWRLYSDNNGVNANTMEELETITIINEELSAALKFIESLKIELNKSGHAVIRKMVADAVTELNLNAQGIIGNINAEDLGKFPNLKTLDVSNVELENIEFPQNCMIETLKIQNNKLNTLNLSNCKNLKYLNCSNNLLSSLALTNCANLQTIYCSNNNLNSLELSQCTKLNILSCTGNELNELNLTDNENLVTLKCGSQESTLTLSLPMSLTNKWKTVWKGSADFENVKLEGETEAPTISINNTELVNALATLYPDKFVDNKILKEFVDTVEELDFGFKQFTITSLSGIENFQNLKKLICANTGLVTCDLSQNKALVHVSLPNNHSLTTLNLSKNTALTYLNLSSCGLSTVDLSNNTKLIELVLKGNNLSSLDLSNNTKLKSLSIYDNKFESFSVENLSNLSSIDCGSQKDNKKLVVYITTAQETAYGNVWRMNSNNTGVEFKSTSSSSTGGNGFNNGGVF